LISANDLSHDTGTRVAVVERRAGALGRCVESAQRAGAARGLLCTGGEGRGSWRACCCCSGPGGGGIGRMHFWTDGMPRSENFLSGAVGWFRVCV
jgi:hypothetical protein